MSEEKKANENTTHTIDANQTPSFELPEPNIREKQMVTSPARGVNTTSNAQESQGVKVDPSLGKLYDGDYDGDYAAKGSMRSRFGQAFIVDEHRHPTFRDKSCEQFDKSREPLHRSIDLRYGPAEAKRNSDTLRSVLSGMPFDDAALHRVSSDDAALHRGSLDDKPFVSSMLPTYRFGTPAFNAAVVETTDSDDRRHTASLNGIADGSNAETHNRKTVLAFRIATGGNLSSEEETELRKKIKDLEDKIKMINEKCGIGSDITVDAKISSEIKHRDNFGVENDHYIQGYIAACMDTKLKFDDSAPREETERTRGFSNEANSAYEKIRESMREMADEINSHRQNQIAKPIDEPVHNIREEFVKSHDGHDGPDVSGDDSVEKDDSLLIY